jgi:hypothetical protein
MAEQTAPLAHHHGEMPVAEHTATYLGVMDLFKWGALGVADLLILLVLTFCTAMGVVPALVISAIVLAVGVFALRGVKGELT